MINRSNVLDKTIAPPFVAHGLENISIHWDSKRDTWIAKILPGEVYYTSGNEMITTVLGSCVSICMRDSENGVGGMNHFMLPDSGQSGADAQNTARYGMHAMELLINGIMKLGGVKERLEVKLFGGGKIISKMTDIGERNIQFSRRFVVTEGFKLLRSDTGGPWPRKIIYHPASGKVFVKRMEALNRQNIIAKESNYESSIKSASEKNDDIELF